MQIQLSFPLLQKPACPIPKSTFFTLSNRRCLAISSACAASPAATATMYELLLVPQTARPEDIKAAYRRQARLWHPDVCPSSRDKVAFAENFIRAREAYEVLSDPVLREDYDTTLSAGVMPSSWTNAIKTAGRKSGGRFGDWESQLEGLTRRSTTRSAANPATWGSRMRSEDQ